MVTEIWPIIFALYISTGNKSGRGGGGGGEGGADIRKKHDFFPFSFLPNVAFFVCLFVVVVVFLLFFFGGVVE